MATPSRLDRYDPADLPLKFVDVNLASSVAEKIVDRDHGGEELCVFDKPPRLPMLV